jgi:hypothetical protein
MTLYHFTAEHLARKIQREGITMGAISLFDERGHLTGIERGWIWLTENAAFPEQSWNTRIMIPYDRCAMRFTVEIPESARHHLSSAIQVISDDFPNSKHLLNWPGRREWRLYHGKVFRRWLTAAEPRYVEVA